MWKRRPLANFTLDNSLQRRLVPVLLLLLLPIAGCRSEPKLRLGSLPYPGVPGLFVIADTEDLGEHRYRSVFHMFDKEKERGLIYTERAGFVDLSHIRDAGDWTRFAYERVEPALRTGQSSTEFGGPDKTRVYVTFNYPQEWYSLSPADRRDAAQELAVLISQRLAYSLTTWHEVITWYGYSTVPLVSERYSAFTVDDMVAHLVGINAAGDALRDLNSAYNAAMTRAIEQHLDALHPADPETTRQVIYAVEDWWWNGITATKRHLDSAFDDGKVRPMLVPASLLPDGLSSPSDGGEVFELSQLPEEMHGIAIGDFYSVEIEPNVGQWDTIREQLPGKPKRLKPEEHLPQIMEMIREEMHKEFGPAVDVLDDGPSVAQQAT